ncbi:MAG: ZIP family metal transporter [Lachnospiraceae bacterium]|nr:ZIP family metal transporter [Lachnospiraceae bacterium]
MSQAVIWAALGTGFTFLMTALGAAVVFFFKGTMHENVQRAFLGFAAGVMIAASVWSLLIPSIDRAAERNIPIEWIPAAGGFVLGGLFLLALDKLMPHLHLGTDKPEGRPSSMKRVTLLIAAVTLHNIPEGMATGLAFAMAAQNPDEKGWYAAAFALAVGIGIQNFPEGAAISLPLRKEGHSRSKAFLWGAGSGIVEPIFGIATTLAASWIEPVMPWLLAFAAGAMVFVVVEELIPEAKFKTDSNVGTIGFMGGFLIMMILDVALG